MLGNIIGSVVAGAFDGLTDAVGLDNKESSSSEVSESNLFEGSGVGDTFEQLLSQFVEALSGAEETSESEPEPETADSGLEGQLGQLLSLIGQLFMALAPMLDQIDSESSEDATAVV